MRDKSCILGEQVTSQMSEEYFGKLYYVIFGNFFISMKLKILLKSKTYACRIAQTGSKNWASELKKPRDLTLKRGECGTL
jgi:hypothetical protein